MFRNVRLLGQAAVAACVLVGWSGTGTAGAQSACADLSGTVDPDQICHVHSTGSSYNVDFNFPVGYPDQQALTDYLTQDRDRFVSYVTQLPPRNDLPYDLEAKGTTYRSGTPAPGTESVVLELYNESGGAHPVTSYKAFNYDLSKRVPITFDTLFKPGTNRRRRWTRLSSASWRNAGTRSRGRSTSSARSRTRILRSPTTR
jgi:hypothetical protein